MRIVLTGATGLLGRNLLFEILKQNLTNLDDLEIIVLGRSQKATPLEERLENIIMDDGYEYIGLTPVNSTDVTKSINRHIISIPFDLTKDDLGISSEDFNILKNKKIDHFFHIAALTDFRSGPIIKAKLEEVNVKGTWRILELVKELNIGQFIYIGSAYSCGNKTGVVKPDYINPNEGFRNPYEESKLKAEVLVREFAEMHKISIKIFRPSTICGRLIEKPLGSINKFDVFYAWGAFFLRLKYKHLKSFDRIYQIEYEVPIRIHFNPNSGLNIVPSDYAAKVLYQASINNWKGQSFYLSNYKETPHKLYVSMILEALAIKGRGFVVKEPEDKNEIEKFYYRTVGSLFTPYASTDPILFDISNLEENLRSVNLSCPSVDKRTFTKLIDFAKKKYFNLNMRNKV